MNHDSQSPHCRCHSCREVIWRSAATIQPCPAPIGNYYGAPTLVMRNGQNYLALEDNTGTRYAPVSPEFSAAWRTMFEGYPKSLVELVAEKGLGE